MSSLNEADGLDHPMVVPCDFIYALRRDLIGAYHGTVVRERRLAVYRTILKWFEWPPA